TSNIAGALATDGTYLYSGGPSVWKRPLEGLDVAVKKDVPISSLLLYPNPASHNIHIRTSFGGRGSARIYDVKGMAVAEQKFYPFQSAEDISISLSGLSEGIYYCRLEDETGNIVAKASFVVVRK